ncbi:hypothetical protein [Synechococcus phage Ssp-JY38]
MTRVKPEDRNREIAKLFDEIADDHDEKSTIWLMQMTCDRWYQAHGEEIDHGDVATALAEQQGD